MDKDTIDRMRNLREKTRGLNKTIKEDLEKFLHEKDEVTFRRLPWSPSDENDVGITTTSTCLMALAVTGELIDFYDGDMSKTQKAFEMIMKGDKNDKWISSKLDPCNAFTTTLVLRTFGFLKQKSALDKKPSEYKHNNYPVGDKSLVGIIKHMAEDIEERFKIFKYPATPAIVYWFIDAIQRAEMNFEKWEDFYAWTSHTFCKQLSRASAEQEALMDPIAMAMAACLSAKLRNIAKDAKLGTSPKMLTHLPSMIELKNSINILFTKQSKCGIWPKYFPLFHYPDSGSNYCFAFEMLEAILNEFGAEILINDFEDTILGGLEQAVQWCYDNRMDYLDNKTKVKYSGWNSGGQLITLEGGVPESWTTAIIHMFLDKLQDVLTDRIEDLILSHYRAKKYDKADSDEWDKLLDIDLELEQKKEKITVKDFLDREMLSKIPTEDRKHFRNNPIKNSRSALLFGPPGTSKTALVIAIAQKLGWPYIAIDPSHFLKEGLENIYSEADNVFRDLSDLSGTVILFDEMDALVQTREEDEGYSLDVTSRFLTTSMLPKLAALHDEGRSIFFMATNYQEKFDPAIKRPGRFDLLLCMWPPSWANKLEHLNAFYEESDVEDCKEILRTYVDGTSQKDLLEKFTYGEMKAFIGNLKGTSGLMKTLKSGKKDFLSKVEMWAKYITLNVSTKKSKKITKKYIEQKKLSRVQL